MAGTEFPSGPDGAYVDEPGVVNGIPFALFPIPGAQHYPVAGGSVDTPAGVYHGAIAHSEPFSARAPTETDLGMAAADLAGSLAWWSIKAASSAAKQASGSVWTYLTNGGGGQTTNSGMTTQALIDGVQTGEELGDVTYMASGNLAVYWSIQGALAGDPASFVDTGLPYPIAEWVKSEITVSAPTRTVGVTVSTEAGPYWSGSAVLPPTLPGLAPGDPLRSYSLQSVSYMSARADYFTGFGGFDAYTMYVDDLFAIFDTPPLRKYPRHDGRGMSPVRRGYPVNSPRLMGGAP